MESTIWRFAVRAAITFLCSVPPAQQDIGVLTRAAAGAPRVCSTLPGGKDAEPVETPDLSNRIHLLIYVRWAGRHAPPRSGCTGATRANDSRSVIAISR